MKRIASRSMALLALGALLVMGLPPALGAAPAPGELGPYDLTFLEGGVGIERALPADAPILAAGAPWSLTGWVRPDVAPARVVLLAAVGVPATGACICLALDARGVILQWGEGGAVGAAAALPVGTWQAVGASYDGHRVRLYLGGAEVASEALATRALAASLRLAPAVPGAGGAGDVAHFGGSLARFGFAAGTLTPAAMRSFALHPPRFELLHFTAVGVGWPVQVRAWTGLQVPQDAWTLPQARTAPATPHATAPVGRVALQPTSGQSWLLRAWRLAAAPGVAATADQLSQPGFDDASWYDATVPGTVLSTLVDRGVYPDPDHGLDNMAIPESLARQDYWYRTTFTLPAAAADRRLALTFQGINYAAQVWLNGTRLGDIKGAFIRGVFDVTGLVQQGQVNALAVRVSPPPHPGIPSEESRAFGPGENGGALAIDGPTFIATEGWDWIPGIRDRNTGLWQDVELSAAGVVRILDPTVTTRLPLPRRDEATLEILVPLANDSASARAVTVQAAFEGVTLSKQLLLAPGTTQLRLAADEFPQLRIREPRLWWPNGYGAANLYHLALHVQDAAGESDSRSLRFGIRQLSYELSLFDHAGRLRRVEVDPTAGSARGERLVDVRHEALKQVPNGWAASLTSAGESSPAVHEVASQSLSPYLVIRVNGVPIAARGGSWGMDDSRKRVARERLEPYFRLHREAHVNIIRNWLGQDTEEAFYDLADEYGLLVLNDFWVSTQDFQLEPQDPALFLANARDVIARYRHHPSIAVWFGRNEGVPQPIINEGLAELVATLDGTRYYTGSSNRVNLQDSGPYNYRAPVGYFTDLAAGFSVEVGTPSLATLESLEASIPAADRWPLGDTIAYHDWHFGGNGDVASFMAALEQQFGAANSLADFERKAQMLNYVDYRAIFEGFQAHLWTRNSGRLLWMTHPSWPSNHWQMYSSDYDTQASYYGVKKAAEPLHVQMNLPDYALAVVNTTLAVQPALVVTSRLFSLQGRLLDRRTDHLEAAANQVTTLAPLELAPQLAREGVVLVALELRAASGELLSGNVYWQGKDEQSLRALVAMPPQPVRARATVQLAGGEMLAHVRLEATGQVAALATKLTLVDAQGQRILPAYYSDNYLALLPGEPREVEIRYPRATAAGARILLRGWNVVPTSVALR
jgi:hypothetical protein